MVPTNCFLCFLLELFVEVDNSKKTVDNCVELVDISLGTVDFRTKTVDIPTKTVDNDIYELLQQKFLYSFKYAHAY